MNRRRALAAVGSVALGGYGALRVGDHRPYGPDGGPVDGPPDERVAAAARRLHTHDHRAVTEVHGYADGTEGSYLRARYRRVHEHSRRRHLAVYTAFRLPATDPGPASGGLLASLHRSYAANDASLPRTSVVHVTDGTVVADWDAPTPEGPDAPPRVGGADTYRSAKPDDYPGFGAHLLDGRADWREVARTDDGARATRTYRLDDRDGYARAVPLLGAVEVHDGSRLTATLDAETGLLRRLADRRVVTRRVDDGGGEGTTRRLRYDLVTRFDRHGDAAAPRPAGTPRTTPAGYLRELAADLSRY